MGEQDSKGEELWKTRVDPKIQHGAGEGRSAYVFAANGASTMHFGPVETLSGSNAHTRSGNKTIILAEAFLKRRNHNRRASLSTEARRPLKTNA
jgi:hypothetical protein